MRLGHRKAVALVASIGIALSAQRAAAQCQHAWRGGFSPPGLPSRDAPTDMVVFDDGHGPGLYICGYITPLEGLFVRGIIRWDGDGWSSVGPAADVDVFHALAVFDDGGGPALYAAGEFTRFGSSLIRGVARWDGREWSDVAGGLDGTAHALHVFDDGGGPALYVGGSFNTAGGVPTPNVAKWDGAAWSAVGDPPAVVDLLQAAAGTLYARAAGRLWRWDEMAWSPIDGIDGEAIRAMAEYDDGTGPALYVGGAFAEAGGQTVNQLARWDGARWSGVGGGCDGPVEALRVVRRQGRDVLHVGGKFSAAGGTPASRIAAWDGEGWTGFGSGVSYGGVRAIAAYDEGHGRDLYVAGSLRRAGDGVQTEHVARWDGERWSALGQGLDGRVWALQIHDDGTGAALYATGNVASAGGVRASGIARWSGRYWTPLGSGLDAAGVAMAVFDDGRGPALYVGGPFVMAGERVVNGIARWDGLSWEEAGGGVSGTTAEVNALTTWDDGSGEALYAAGEFPYAGGEFVNNIARWDGNSWRGLGHGIWGAVYSLTTFDDGQGAALYVGGEFMFAGGAPAACIARWDGEKWSDVGGGMNARVRALMVYDDAGTPTLVAGGSFNSAGGVDAARIARWDGARWRRFGNGLNDSCMSLAVFDAGDGPALYAGGEFTYAGRQTAPFIARWLGGRWEPVAGGMLPGYHVFGNVAALRVFDDGDGPSLFAGGWFSGAGGRPSENIARLGCDATACDPCDVNCDGVVDQSDIEPFIALVTTPGTPACSACSGDVNGDGEIDAFDIEPFIDCLSP